MLFENTNIEEQLRRTKLRTYEEEKLIHEVYALLQKSTKSDSEIHKRITQKNNSVENNFVFDLLETDKIFHIDQIKDICINYRLRFLDSKYFKAQIPEEAIDKIKILEEAHNIDIEGFKIIAPSKLFKLADKDDPLLFAPIGNGYYYLIHKWGNDLHPLRRILVWPFKNVVNLTLLVVLLSFLTSLLVPNGLFSKNSSQMEFLIIFFFMFKSIAAVVIFYGFALGKNFNPAIWNSKYFNA
ncbi:hypothetical protein [uncultured Eudoraea sp.]|uniref:hypothetical protein n=1 Tax=uncultured Eudoraea sp. TaxID=1035614 RepID=UPI00262AF230|nr:hypothetical protein [uncultured Eudoraea sp.]